jgi:hypothetical protein
MFRRASITAGPSSFGGVAALSLMAVTVIGLQASAGTAAAAVPPKITSAFTPNLIGVGGSTALSYTITNPNASSLSAVAFTDTLPSSLTVDDPNGEFGTCGSSSVVTANPGSQSISLTGGSLKPGASCTVSVSLAAAQAGGFPNDTGPVSSSAGSSTAGDTETLTVLPPPSVSLTHVRTNAKYTFGEVVRPRYSCSQPEDAAALADCSAVDDLGSSIRSGGALNTKTAGSHSLTVSATSSDGLVTSDTVNYTVLPNNRFTISKLKVSGQTVIFALALPGPGTVTVAELVGRNAVGSYRRVVETKRTVTVDVRPTAAGRTLLGTGGSRSATLEVTYVPRGGRRHSVTKRGIIVG